MNNPEAPDAPGGLAPPADQIHGYIGMARERWANKLDECPEANEVRKSLIAVEEALERYNARGEVQDHSRRDVPIDPATGERADD